jgi:K+-transporting ATPase KdpF subunit
MTTATSVLDALSPDSAIALLLAAVVLAYLVYALLRPERF